MSENTGIVRWVLSVGGVLLSAGLAVAQCPNATFVSLGVPPGGAGSQVNAVNRDGAVSAGIGYFGNLGVATRWVNGSIEVLGALPGHSTSAAHAVSGDGLTIVGTSGSGVDTRAFRWSESGGIEAIPGVGSGYSVARSVSADGFVIVGDRQNQAFAWVSGQGLLDFGCPPCLGSAMGVSSDGQVIAGWGSAVNGIGVWRWTQGAGLEPLSPTGYMMTMSSDGQFVFGSLGSWEQAVRWSSNGQVRTLGLPAGGGFQSATSTNDDGSIAVGMRNGSDHFLWTDALGWLDLRSVMLVLGADLTTWSEPFTNYGSYVSGDGETVVGTGWREIVPGQFRLEAWKATLPILLASAPTSQTVCVGAGHAMKVKVVGTAAPFVFTWRRNGVPLEPTDPRVSVSTSADGRVSIASISEFLTNDVGVYDCVAQSVAFPCRVVSIQPVSLSACYPNCDCSTVSPVLTSNDFQCFLNAFAAGEARANCDQSTGTPQLTANDFQCFLNKFVAGCP